MIVFILCGLSESASSHHSADAGAAQEQAQRLTTEKPTRLQSDGTLKFIIRSPCLSNAEDRKMKSINCALFTLLSDIS